jgi:hypothetical protein
VAVATELKRLLPRSVNASRQPGKLVAFIMTSFLGNLTPDG